jgi:protein-S-isoprenylcysteine O-methyltransferase Ste14
VPFGWFGSFGSYESFAFVAFDRSNDANESNESNDPNGSNDPNDQATIICAVRAHAPALSPPALIITWLGALLFFLSLAYFLFSYVTRFGVPASGGDLAAPITWNVALFTGFALHHSLFAREPMRAAIARMLPQPLERSFYVWVASLMFIAVCALWRPVPGVAWRVEGPMLWALRAVLAAGIVLTLSSAVVLDIRDLAGLRPARGAIEFKTSGPYGWVRHPIYSGWFLMVFAVSPMTMTRLVFAVVSCAYLIIAIPFEERSMRTAASDRYERYVRQVPWRLVPRIY